MYKEKQQTESKIKDISYEQLELNEYLKSEMFSKKERELLVNIRSKCYNAKSNFKRRHLNRTDCTLGCPETEDQKHIFLNCPKVNEPSDVTYEDIDGSVIQQKTAVEVFLKIDKKRKQAIEALLTGGDPCYSVCLAIVD